MRNHAGFTRRTACCPFQCTPIFSASVLIRRGIPASTSFNAGVIDAYPDAAIAMRDAGKAILLVSVELDEILSLSDRIAVMFDGQIMGFKDPKTTNERELGLLMAGVSGGAGK